MHGLKTVLTFKTLTNHMTHYLNAQEYKVLSCKFLACILQLAVKVVGWKSEFGLYKFIAYLENWIRVYCVTELVFKNVNMVGLFE